MARQKHWDDNKGVLITGVKAGEFLAKAKQLKSGDVVLSISEKVNDKWVEVPINTMDDFKTQYKKIVDTVDTAGFGFRFSYPIHEVIGL